MTILLDRWRARKANPEQRADGTLAGAASAVASALIPSGAIIGSTLVFDDSGYVLSGSEQDMVDFYRSLATGRDPMETDSGAHQIRNDLYGS